MGDLVVYPHAALPDALRWQAVAAVRIVWPWTDDPRGGGLRKPQEARLRPVHVAVVDGDLLLSYAVVVRLAVAHAGATYDLGGLGSVFTFPAWRRRGYGGRVVDAAAAHLQESGADVAALFCDPGQPELPGFYARRGWSPVEAPTLVGPPGAPAVERAPRLMRFLSARGRAGRPAFEAEPLRLPHAW